MKLAIVTTHPIQYNAPLFRLLAKKPGLDIRVFYTWEQSSNGEKFDPGFGRKITWDIPLLEGYDYKFIKNVANNPGSHHFRGIVNPDLKFEIEAWNADSVLVYGWNFYSHLNCMRYFHKKRQILFRGDSTLLDEKKGVKKLLRRTVLRWVYSHVDKVLYAGTNNKHYFLAHGLHSDQLFYVPHVIDNERFSEPSDSYESEAGNWRKQLHISKDNKVILFAGKFVDKKNPGFVIEMAKNIADPAFRFILAGNGPLENSLREKAAIDKRILFIDFQNQQLMPVLYRLGDVFILPSSGPGETWGLAVNEAMACSRPVLVSNRCGCAVDLVKEGENGYIIASNDPAAASEKLIDMFRNQEKLLKMGVCSSQRIRDFSISAAADRLFEALRN